MYSQNMASLWLRTSRSEVTATQRERAKRICYGIIYGMGTTSLAEELKVDKVCMCMQAHVCMRMQAYVCVRKPSIVCVITFACVAL